MESLIKNNHCCLYTPEHVNRAGKIIRDYFMSISWYALIILNLFYKIQSK